jgi:hypothetical protein
MSDELADLQRRVAALEREVAELRNVNGTPAPDDEPMPEIVQLCPSLRPAWEDRHRSAEAWRKVKEQLGIQDLKPIGAENLQKLLIAEGVDPNSNEFSQGIIDMREE